MRERITLAGYTLGWRVVRLLPETLAYALFALIADVTWWRHGAGVRRLEGNLARAAPPGTDLRALSRRGMRSYLRYWCDLFRLPGWSHERIVSTCRLVDGHHLDEAQAVAPGLVVAIGHQGNWDHAGAWSTSELLKVTTVAERLKPEQLYEEFVAYREALGMEILPLTGGVHLFATLSARVRAGGFVPLLCDRDLTNTGIAVQLLGETARMAPGPALLAVQTGRPLVPVSIWYERLPKGSAARWGTVLKIHPGVPVPAAGSRREKVAIMMQACADALGNGFRQHPEDWHMLQRVFEADLDPR